MLLPGDILPIGTVSVVESFNLRGDFDLFSFWLMLDGCGVGARGGMLVSLWEIGVVFSRGFELLILAAW